MPGMSHGQDGARAKQTAVGTVNHHTAMMTALRGNRWEAHAPGMFPAAMQASMMALSRPIVKREAPRSRAYTGRSCKYIPTPRAKSRLAVASSLRSRSSLDTCLRRTSWVVSILRLRLFPLRGLLSPRVFLIVQAGAYLAPSALNGTRIIT